MHGAFAPINNILGTVAAVAFLFSYLLPWAVRPTSCQAVTPASVISGFCALEPAGGARFCAQLPCAPDLCHFRGCCGVGENVIRRDLGSLFSERTSLVPVEKVRGASG